MLLTSMIMDCTAGIVSKPPQLNVFFIRIAMVIVSLHSNRNPKIEIGTSDWGIVVIDLAMHWFGIIRTWGV